MKRVHLFEFMDLPWYPHLFRHIQTDYLQFVTTLGAGHQNLVPLFAKALHHAGTTEIVDLCSGGTGPWIHLQEYFKEADLCINIKLTDKYPSPEAVQMWSNTARQGIEYLSEPVDATDVPGHLKGMRTLFEGFHHFKPEQARSILRDAVEKRVAIGIFEASLKPPLGPILLLLAPITTFMSYLFLTPFIKPRTLSRFLWTYLIPIVPLATCWDGVISLLRVYSPQALQELTAPLQREDYVWEIGQASTETPLFVFTYLVGYPV
ncbi:MAG: hypothetical protein JXA33_07705 [Anaerolineae bacterium]|nr:hypothetical protein [Anaerolineae bacterium]